MKGIHLGEFEELILLTVAALGDKAYAVSVREELYAYAHRKVNISAVHSALYRLEDKDFLLSEFGGSTNQRGGKKKRYFRITASGVQALQEGKDMRQRFWQNIPQLSTVSYS